MGEIGDVKQSAADAETQSQIYWPVNQSRDLHSPNETPGYVDGRFGSIVLRSQLPLERMIDSLRAVVRSIDPQLRLTHIESMEQVVSEGQASRRFNTVLVSCFAIAAVLLAVLGVYSVIAFSAALRTHELAIRLALGAQRTGVLRLVLAWGAKLGLAGCVLGGISAVFATRLLRSLLFNVNPLDPVVLVLVAGSHLPAGARGLYRSRAACRKHSTPAGAARGVAPGDLPRGESSEADPESEDEAIKQLGLAIRQLAGVKCSATGTDHYRCRLEDRLGHFAHSHALPSCWDRGRRALRGFAGSRLCSVL